MPGPISSQANPLVKKIRSLRQKKGREETGLFLVEGIHPVGEAVQAGWDLEALIYAPEQLKSAFAQQLLDEQARQGVHCFALTRELFAALSEKDNPQGILAIFHQRHLTLENLNLAQFSFGAAAISPQDPGNVGTILRTLDAVGVDALFLLDGGVELYHPSVIRASMGTLFWKPVVQAHFEEFIIWIRDKGYQLVGSSAHGGIDYKEFLWGNKPVILLLGSEQKGLSPQQVGACDAVISMPMMGRASSLNLAVAAGVLLYQIMEKKQERRISAPARK